MSPLLGEVLESAGQITQMTPGSAEIEVYGIMGDSRRARLYRTRRLSRQRRRFARRPAGRSGASRPARWPR